MKTPEIPISQIFPGTRYREDYGDIDQLCHSIKTKGLISPIAVGLTANVSEELRGDTTLPYVLLAGGRRLRAMTKLQWSMAPVRIYDQPLSTLDLRSIELAENFDRKDMTYAEELALMREINDLQTAIHGEKIARAANAPGWSQADTAKLLKKSPATVTKDLQLADAIQAHPELGLDKCKNKAEAFKRLKQAGKVISNSIRAQTYEQTTGSTDKLFAKLSSSYVIGDCFATLSKLPSNSLDIIEIDPPYAIDLTSVKRENSCDGYNEIPAEQYHSFMARLFHECYRVLRQDSWLICWFGPDPWFSSIAEWLRAAEFKLTAIPGIWAKPQGQSMQPETYLGSSYEMFFYARKGSPKLQKPGRPNIFQFPTVPASRKHHPTQRPIELMVELYSTFCPPNSNGFIPCLGSGVGLLAGHACKINMIGTDLSDAFKDGYIISLNEYLQVKN